MEHRYSARLTSKPAAVRWPAIKGEIFEGDVCVGRFSRAGVSQGFIPSIETHFYSSQARRRFESFADSLSVAARDARWSALGTAGEADAQAELARADAALTAARLALEEHGELMVGVLA